MEVRGRLSPRLDLFQITEKSSLLLYDPFYDILNGVVWGGDGGFLNKMMTITTNDICLMPSTVKNT